MKTAIKLEKVTKTYQSKIAVKDISFEVKQGELFALLGINGAGKTTLIRIISCLTKPSAGDVFVLGHSVLSNPQQVKRSISVSPQETAIAPNLTVRENLALIAAAHNFAAKKSREKINEMMILFELKSIEHQKSKTLSGGWKRRLSIAMAFISEPRIIFLDEPTLGLDILARHALWKVIEKIKDHTTIILTTHYLEEVQSLADRVCIMKDGQVQSIGTIEKLLQQTKTNRFEDAFINIVSSAESEVPK